MLIEVSAKAKVYFPYPFSTSGISLASTKTQDRVNAQKSLGLTPYWDDGIGRACFEHEHESPCAPPIGPAMFYPIAFLFFSLWWLGIAAQFRLGGAIHLLLLIAAVLFFAQLITGRLISSKGFIDP
jgi:hypothetical protein